MIVFVSNYLNHHQAMVSDELYELSDHQYKFVSTTHIPQFRVKLGYSDFSDRPYLLKSYENPKNGSQAMELVRNADVAIFGGGKSPKYQLERLREGKFSFEVSERWLKRGWINLLSPRLLKNMWYYHTLFHDKPLYKLCSSAYAAGDQYLLHSFKDKCYKWGYFTKVDEWNIEEHFRQQVDGIVRIMWCARYLDWKHPELPLRLAQQLKAKGYRFIIDMYGSGVELESTKKLCTHLGVEDAVNFVGNKPNDEILRDMRDHDIFLFTSDKQEGWGAVLNEAMSNGCTVVASDAIGSVPFLVKDGVNGYTFKSKNLESLYDKVIKLIESPNLRKAMAIQAYHDMVNIWSPKAAAKNLLQLIDDLQHGRETSIMNGPCSKAMPL